VTCFVTVNAALKIEHTWHQKSPRLMRKPIPRPPTVPCSPQNLPEAMLIAKYAVDLGK
jgi:hypothetical protein